MHQKSHTKIFSTLIGILSVVSLLTVTFMPTESLAAQISTITGTKRGLKTTYTDGRSLHFILWDTMPRKAQVAAFAKKKLAVVVHPKGKNVHLLHAETGRQFAQKLLARTSYKYQRIYTTTFHHKKFFVVVSKSPKRNESRVSIIRRRLKRKTLGKKSTYVLNNVQLQIKNTQFTSLEGQLPEIITVDEDGNEYRLDVTADFDLVR